MGIEKFTLTQTVHETGISRTTLRQWIDLGFICPSIHKSKTIGKPHFFSKGDICHLIAMSKLMAIGFTRAKAYQLLRRINFEDFAKNISKSPILWGHDEIEAVLLDFRIVFDVRRFSTSTQSDSAPTGETGK
jgi:hypothetical protein